MRIVALLILALGISSSAFAADLECVRPISPNERDITVADTWPYLRVKQCKQRCTGAPGFQFCVTQCAQPLVDVNQVCGQQVNQQFDCQTREGSKGFTDYVETRCRRGIGARLEVNSRGVGKLHCLYRGQIEETYRLGECN